MPRETTRGGLKDKLEHIQELWSEKTQDLGFSEELMRCDIFGYGEQLGGKLLHILDTKCLGSSFLHPRCAVETQASKSRTFRGNAGRGYWPPR